MLRLSNAFIDRSILSLRTGAQIGVALEPIINPNNLKIEAWKAKDIRQKGDFILPAGEIRDFIIKGVVVNDHDALTLPEDMIRLKPVMDIAFKIEGKLVVTDAKRKIGKVSDYSVDDGFYIKKIYVTPPILKSLTSQQIVIDRDSIVEVTDKKIVVSDDSTVKAGSGVPVTVEA